ncbi:branched-chain amino acid ABC transporter substrate-binding protein [Desulfamplus magnetovallimortis]|uniref:branched-chain amino acid ABC transporter substrate-binding protein n=1 Tax=Desulfamplus magnetovallimortis TaxID=1246637 RepID=UPI001FE2D4DC|nr:branched-chain amino acid ABC transporter substrate-binding protein [Desulfamplus magnetovallimortis]
MTVPNGSPVKIGVLQALSGKSVSLGTEQVRGIELAVDSYQGKIAGHDIEMQKEDTSCSFEGGANAALKIVSNPDIVGIIGTTCSIAAASASKIMSDAGMVMISGNNSAPFLTSMNGKRAPDFHEGFLRTANNEENAGKAAATFAFNNLGKKRAATVNDGDIYTRGLSEGFESAFRALGGTIVLSATVNKGDDEMGPLMEAVKYSAPDILFFPLFQPEGNKILKKAREIPELADLTLMSDGALIESTFIDDINELGTGMYFVGPARPETDGSLELEKKYREKFNMEPMTSYYLTAFDAATLLFNAIETVAVRENNGTLYIDRKKLRENLYSTRNFKGVTGTLNCNSFGDCALPRFNILRLDDPKAGIAGLTSNIIYTYFGKTDSGE